MPVTLDASTPAPVFNDSLATTSLVTASFTPPSGSIIVVKPDTGFADLNFGTVSGGSLTYTNWENVGTTGSTGRVGIWTATGAGSAMTVTVSFTGSADTRGLVVEVWTGAQLAGTPAHHSTAAGGTAPSDTITTVADNSVVSWINCDNTGASGTVTYRSSATQDALHAPGGASVYSAYQAAATAGSQTYGMTGPTGQTPVLAAIEIQASGGTPAFRPFHTMQPRRP